MGSVNNNYISGLAGFEDADNFYEAAAVGTFNPVGPGIGAGFGASVLFWLDGGFQNRTGGTVQVLWGNSDLLTDGWAIGIDDGTLFAGVGDGVAFNVSDFDLDDTEVGGYVERLIQASLWYDPVGDEVLLTVNGQVAPPETSLAYADAAAAARVGTGVPAVGGGGAINARIVGVSFIDNIPAPDLGPYPGTLAAQAYRSARASLTQGFISQVSGIDWAHRYECASIRSQGTISKNAVGAVATGLPLAPASLEDVGSSGPLNATTPGFSATPSPLALTGQLLVDQVKNPDWYTGPAWVFP